MSHSERSSRSWASSAQLRQLRLRHSDSDASTGGDACARRGDLMGDSAKMNMWLHRTVLQKIADNCGNIPNDLLV
jgi:hypothetical protein